MATAATLEQTHAFDPAALARLDDTQRARVAKALPRLKVLAQLLDEAFTIPVLKVKVGLDPLIGLIPVVGDWISNGLNLYIVVEAIRMGVPKLLLARMIGNVVFDAILGIVPIIGDLLDIGFKANKRNVELLVAHFEGAPRAKK